MTQRFALPSHHHCGSHLQLLKCPALVLFLLLLVHWLYVFNMWILYIFSRFEKHLVYKEEHYTKIMTLWKGFDYSMHLKSKLDEVQSVLCARPNALFQNIYYLKSTHLSKFKFNYNSNIFLAQEYIPRDWLFKIDPYSQ